MRAGIFGNNYQPGKLNNIRAVFDKLRSLGVHISVDSEFYEYLVSEFNYKPDIEDVIDEISRKLDVVISLGGDGTFLRTAARVGRTEIPIIGVNTGRLGFLADIGANETELALDEIFHGNYRIERRSLLELETADLNHRDNFALNEVAIQKRDTSAMITVHTWLNDEYLNTYLADGLVIATPTGSTAYSMSVNGPLIVPEAKNFVLSPVAPHSLNVRPLVIPENYVIRLKVESRDRNFLVSLDGRSAIFPSGREFFVRKAKFSVKLVKLKNRNFYNTLSDKLLWGSDRRN